MILNSLSTEMVRRLDKLGATHYSVAKNYCFPYNHAISSVHFFSDNCPDVNGALPEVAHFIPELHSSSHGILSGLKEAHRMNAVDVDVKQIPNTIKIAPYLAQKSISRVQSIHYNR